MHYEQLPAEVRHALDQRGISQVKVSDMSALDVFHEFCQWEGLLGSWSVALWRITSKLHALDVAP
jgi:hypothetical protein